jgi:hypothetical protein
MVWVPSVVKESLLKQHNVGSVFVNNDALLKSALQLA